MTDQKMDDVLENANPPAQPERKPWSTPVLTISSIEGVTHGTTANTRKDGGSFFS